MERADVKVTKIAGSLNGRFDARLPAMVSSGCVFCDLNLEPVKLRRRWVHHLPKKGKLMPCEAKNLKPGS